MKQNQRSNRGGRHEECKNKNKKETMKERRDNVIKRNEKVE